tara:strand:- start:163 stop:825 length:663 start_codon:yes stop_codon:yes gene_type:complete
MSIVDTYKVKAIKKHECKEWLLYKHYLKSVPIIIFSFGLYEKKELKGIIVFGNPSRIMSKHCDYELSRLVVNDGLKKNVLSFFVSQSLKLLKKPSIIVSYADMGINHHGYIYQATNWLYTGLTEKDGHPNIFIDNEQKHPRSLYAKHGTSSTIRLKEIYGDRVCFLEKKSKHRYFYLLGNRKEKKDMKNNLKYDILPYPKGNNERYDASYKPNTQTQLFD